MNKAGADAQEGGPARIADAPLRWELHEDALLVPSASRSVYRNIDGAVFDRQLRPITASYLTRTWTAGQISHAPDITGLELAGIEHVDTPHIYGGYFFDHFGHFLLESLARAWVVDAVGPLPFAWASGEPPNAWQAEILALLGLSMEHRFPRRPTRFRRLIIPDPGYRIQGIFHPRHAAFLTRFETRRTGDEVDRIWLSRSEIAPKGRSRGEVVLQNELARYGWRIVHPQRLPVAEQLRTLARAGVIAGLEGSAFHAAVLLNGPAAPFITLRRTLNRNYSAIAERKQITAIDLFGAFRIHDRADLSLARPRRLARTVQQLADHIAECRQDTDCLAAVKARAEALHDFDSWSRRERWRWIAHARAAAKRRKIGQRLRRAVRRRLGL